MFETVKKDGRSTSMKKKKDKNTDADLSSSLVLDTEGDHNEGDAQNDITYAEEVPQYDSKFTGYLTVKEFSTETGRHVPNDSVPKKTCFNCLGDHNMNDCPHERDRAKIARNRKVFLASRLSLTRRYHEIDEARFGQFQPGKISKELRYALGLKSNELPDFFYRMRLQGYPPGWLKEAEVSTGDLSLFDGEGKAAPHPDQEEGETDTVSVRYNVDRLISFPGFNIPVPKQYRDDSAALGYPGIQPHHRREEFERIMTMNKVVKRKKRKLKESRPRRGADDVVRGGEMDIDDSDLHSNTGIEFNPPLPAELPPPLPPEEETEDGEIVSDDSGADVLSDMEKANTSQTPKQDKGKSTKSSASFFVLDTEGDCVASTPDDNQTNDSSQDDHDIIPSSSMNGCSEDSEEGNSQHSVGFSDSSPDSPRLKKLRRSQSKGYKLGVPIPESCTPYKELPPPEKWSVEITDHILFDNLPDSLGTWRKIQGIMSNVKMKMKELFEEDSD